MKALFWSPIHGQAGTTGSLLAVSLLTGMYYRKKAVLTQTQFNYNNLEAPFLGANSYDRDSKEFFREIGIDAAIRSFKAEKLDKSTLDNCCVALDNTNIVLLPGTSRTIRESFDYEMEAVVPSLTRAIEEVYGIVFADISSGKNTLSIRLMQEADIIVVNLSQNMGITDEYFKQYADIHSGKVFYLFGRYDRNSKYNISNIRGKYHKHITHTNSGVIPYNTNFMDAQVDGKVVDFIRNNILCPKKDENYYFMEKAKSAAGKILRAAGVNTERA